MKYAFLILEPKRNDASKMVRHVLCSQSDEDRDGWINALLHYVALNPEPTSATSTQLPLEKSSRGKRLQRRQSDATSPSQGLDHPEPEIIGTRYDQLAAGRRPMTATSESIRQSTWPQVSQDEGSRGIDRRMARSPESRNELRQPAPVVPLRSPYRAPISAPMNGAPITDETAWSSTQRDEERRREEKRAKKRSVWGFLSKGDNIVLTLLIDRLSWSYNARSYSTYCSASTRFTTTRIVRHSSSRCS
jgi:RalA-binding protein 1